MSSTSMSSQIVTSPMAAATTTQTIDLSSSSMSTVSTSLTSATPISSLLSSMPSSTASSSTSTSNFLNPNLLATSNSNSSPTGSTSTSPSPSSTHSSALSTGASIGIGISITLSFLGLLAALRLYFRRRQKAKAPKKIDSTAPGINEVEGKALPGNELGGNMLAELRVAGNELGGNMLVELHKDVFWDTVAGSSDPPTPRGIVVAVREYLTDSSSSPLGTASVACQTMKTNPMLIRNPDPDPVTGDLEPNEGHIVASLLFSLVIARPQTIPKVLELLHAIWSIENHEEGMEKMNKNTWSFDVRNVYWAYRSNRCGEPVNGSSQDSSECAQQWAAINGLKVYEWIRLDEAKMTFREVDQGFEPISLALEHEAWLYKPAKIPGNRRAVEWDVEMLNVEVPAAAAWLRIAGPRIYSCIKKCRFHGPEYGYSRVGDRHIYGEKALI
ncbi:hypothetical protein G7Y89_g8134 [Cudoniella acicularis]|uniref:Uncharacterized protein n=1 Tax=Cudoniella acicularis TaxID=354080 RepID=A0A8H4RJN8_9HELO|nr:hypothetical protein G7Y89_g8134 [Cudoniella acicularis]